MHKLLPQALLVQATEWHSSWHCICLSLLFIVPWIAPIRPYTKWKMGGKWVEGKYASGICSSMASLNPMWSHWNSQPTCVIIVLYWLVVLLLCVGSLCSWGGGFSNMACGVWLCSHTVAKGAASCWWNWWLSFWNSWEGCVAFLFFFCSTKHTFSF